MCNLKISLYIAQLSDRTREWIDEVISALEAAHADDFEFIVVNILEMPEKALEQGIFVTPTLIRESPGPAVRVVGGLVDVGDEIFNVDPAGEEDG